MKLLRDGAHPHHIFTSPLLSGDLLNTDEALHFFRFLDEMLVNDAFPIAPTLGVHGTDDSVDHTTVHPAAIVSAAAVGYRDAKRATREGMLMTASPNPVADAS